VCVLVLSSGLSLGLALVANVFYLALFFYATSFPHLFKRTLREESNDV